MELPSCGIVGFGLYFPEPYRDYNELAELTGASVEVVREKFGIEGFHYPGPEDQTSVMAIRAAEDCLKNTGIDPLEIDLIIYFGENYGDYILYSIGPAVQNAIGAANAWCYQVETKCSSAIIALEQAKKYIQTEDEIKTVMLVGGYRNVDKVDYRDRSMSFFYNLAAGGAAAIIRQDHQERTILGTSAVTDGSFHDAIIVPAGGTVIPITHENLDEPYYHSWRLEDAEGFRDRLGKVTYAHLVGTLKKALSQTDNTIADLDYFIVIHMNPKSHRTLLDLMSLPPEKACYLNKTGHVGQLDPIIGMALAEQEGKIKKGDLVGLSIMGIGYTWASGVVRW